MFSRDFRRPKRAKFKIYLSFEGFVALLSSSFVVAVVVPAGAGVQALRCYFADVSKIVLILLLFGVFPAFCPLACSSLGALLANMALFRVLRAFLARFGGFVWVCVVLVVCVVCGAFVCVRG